MDSSRFFLCALSLSRTTRARIKGFRRRRRKRRRRAVSKTKSGESEFKILFSHKSASKKREREKNWTFCVRAIYTRCTRVGKIKHHHHHHPKAERRRRACRRASSSFFFFRRCLSSTLQNISRENASLLSTQKARERFPDWIGKERERERE